jgi:hypothetical protein
MPRQGIPATQAGLFRAYVMAMQRVEERLRRVTVALDAAGVPYAVCGGNAVAVWVARVDPGATRTTKDVDLLVNRGDLKRLTNVMERVGFRREDLRSLTLFVDETDPDRKTGVHVVWAGEKVRPAYAHAAPTLDDAVRGPGDFSVLSIGALLRMKLTSLRSIDRVHVEDMLRVGLIGDNTRASLPADLLARLQEIETGLEAME